MPKGKAKALEREHSSKPAGPSNARYRPLAPKETIQEAGLARSQSPASESSSTTRELTFINVTDPAQSQSQATRRFVRTQVMKIYAREKRLREILEHQGKPTSSHTHRSKSPSPRSAASHCQCTQPRLEQASRSLASNQKTCKRCGLAVPSSPDSTERPRESVYYSPPIKPVSQSEFSPYFAGWEHGLWEVEPTTLAELEPIQWPIPMDTERITLIAHVFSPSYRSLDPLYIFSLLADRLESEKYPLSIDINSTRHIPSRAQWSAWMSAAFYSPTLLYATLMLSAGRAAFIRGGSIQDEAHVALHKYKGLTIVHLNILLDDIDQAFSEEVVGAVAILACHELMCRHFDDWQSHVDGLKRIIDMRGGIDTLERNGIIRKIVLWCDTLGALMRSSRPHFNAPTGCMKSHLAEPLGIPYTPRLLLADSFHSLAHNKVIFHPLLQALEDVSYAAICVTSVAQTVPSSPFTTDESTLSYLIAARETLIRALLSLAPSPSVSAGSDIAPRLQESLRLAALVFTLSSLGAPLLPPAYHRLTAHVLGQLVSVLEGSPLEDWRFYAEPVLWVYVAAAVGVKDVLGEVEEQASRGGGEEVGSEYEEYRSMISGWKVFIRGRLMAVVQEMELGGPAEVIRALEGNAPGGGDLARRLWDDGSGD